MESTKPLNAQEIHQLIREGRWDDARQALRGLLSRDAHDATGWWLYAKVAPDLTEACTAVENVLALYPAYPQARAALAILKRRLAERPPTRGSPTPPRQDGRDRIETLTGAALLVAVLIVGMVAVVAAITARTSAPPPLPLPVGAEASASLPVVVQVYADW